MIPSPYQLDFKMYLDPSQMQNVLSHFFLTCTCVYDDILVPFPAPQWHLIVLNCSRFIIEISHFLSKGQLSASKSEQYP